MFADKFAVQTRAALVAVALTVLVGPAQAQKPSLGSVASAMEILVLKGANRIFLPLVPGIVNRIKNTFLQTNVSLSKELDEVSLKLAGEYNPKVAELTQQTAQLYAARFSEKELKDLVTFYKSPLGRKVLQEEPQILDQTMANADAWARNMEQVILQRFRAEMKKKGHDL